MGISVHSSEPSRCASNDGCDGVVAVGEDVGFDADLIADGAFGGESSAVDRGGDCLQ